MMAHSFGRLLRRSPVVIMMDAPREEVAANPVAAASFMAHLDSTRLLHNKLLRVSTQRPSGVVHFQSHNKSELGGAKMSVGLLGEDQRFCARFQPWSS